MSFKHWTSASSLGCRQHLLHIPNEVALAPCLKDIIIFPCQVPVYITVDVLVGCPNTTEVEVGRHEGMP